MSVRFLKGFTLAALGLALVAAPAAAQIKWHIGLGANLPQADLKDEAIGDAGTGFGGHAGGTFALGPSPISIKANASYETWKAGDTDESFNMISLTADAVYTFPGVGVRPYILGGLGWHQFGVSNDDFDSESTIGFNGGAGLNFSLGGMGAFVEARYVKTAFEITGTDYDMDNIPIVFGIRF